MKKILVLFLLVCCGTLSAESIFLNSYVAPSPSVEVTFLRQPMDVDKSDASLIVSYGSQGTTVFLVDGGRPNTVALQALLKLRASLLDKLGLSSEEANPDYQVKITCLVTHCHSDHIDELYNNIFPNPRFVVDTLYLAEATKLSPALGYDEGTISDLGQRSRLLAALSKYEPDAKVVVLPFGTTKTIPLDAGGTITAYAPSVDWGEGEPLQFIIDTYYASATPAKRRSDVPTAVTNCNCTWYRLSYEGHSVLFPGDVMKKKKGNDNECLERMIAFYGADTLKSDVVKYPHHGISRTPAALTVQRSLLKEPSSLVVVTAPAAARQSGVEMTRLGMHWFDAAKKSCTVTLDGSGIVFP